MFADVSSIREMIGEEREAARTERETATAKYRRLMEEAFELRLQLALEARQSASAVQSSNAAAGGGSITNIRCAPQGPALKMQEPCTLPKFRELQQKKRRWRRYTGSSGG